MLNQAQAICSGLRQNRKASPLSLSIHSGFGEGFDLLEVNPGWVVNPFGGLVWRDLHYRKTVDFMEFVHGADGGALHIDKIYQPL